MSWNTVYGNQVVSNTKLNECPLCHEKILLEGFVYRNGHYTANPRPGAIGKWTVVFGCLAHVVLREDGLWHFSRDRDQLCRGATNIAFEQRARIAELEAQLRKALEASDQ